LFLFLFIPASYGEWHILKPLRSNVLGGRLGDIDCHLQAGHIYSDPDVVTYGHETTHGVNSRIREEFKVDNGYYLLDDRCFTISDPNFTLREVAEAVPQDKRGRMYNLYLVEQSQYWNNKPLYVFDECTAYINGTIVGIELNKSDRAVDSYLRSREMFYYCRVAQEIARKRNFKEQKSLESFVSVLYNQRLEKIKIKKKKKGWK